MTRHCYMIVLAELSDHEHALRFWNSPEYQQAKTRREGTGRFQVLLVDGPPVSLPAPHPA